MQVPQTKECTLAAIAVEDEYVLATTAIGQIISGDENREIIGKFIYKKVSAPKKIIRSAKKYEFLREDGDFTSSVLVNIVSDFWNDAKKVCPSVLGISTFGSIDINQCLINHTPSRGPNSGKKVQLDIKNSLKNLDIPIAVDNDATAAAVGEYAFGVGRYHHSDSQHAFAYVWAGRGINAGIVINGAPWQGNLHPEVGHLVAKRYEKGGVVDTHPGNCGLHGDCLNGLAGYRSIEERVRNFGWSEDEAVDAVSYYIAQICSALTLTVAPRRIIIGGITIRAYQENNIIEKIRHHYIGMVRGFPGYDEYRIVKNIIVESVLGDNASLLGILDISRMKIFPDLKPTF